MTLADIARMLKYAKVPRSKTVEHLYPKPLTIVEVPAQYVPVVRNVVKQLARPGQAINVCALSPHAGDVGLNEHVLFKIKNAPDSARMKHLSKETVRQFNGNVVIDFARVAS